MAVVVETLTDNKNRTAADMRFIFDRGGGALGVAGCAAIAFETKGILLVDKEAALRQGKNDEDMMTLAVEANAEDLIVHDSFYEIQTAQSDYSAAYDALCTYGFSFIKSGIERIPFNYAEISKEFLPKVLKMLDAFDDNDDVQEVYHNAILEE